MIRTDELLSLFAHRERLASLVRPVDTRGHYATRNRRGCLMDECVNVLVPAAMLRAMRQKIANITCLSPAAQRSNLRLRDVLYLRRAWREVVQ